MNAFEKTLAEDGYLFLKFWMQSKQQFRLRQVNLSRPLARKLYI
ncbi:MAG: hypothetical protein ACPHTD_15715 [Gammaproteobacteria bacterium]